MPTKYPRSLPNYDAYDRALAITEARIVASWSAGEPISDVFECYTEQRNDLTYHQGFLSDATRFGYSMERFDDAGEPVDPHTKATTLFALGSIAGLMTADELHGRFVQPDAIYPKLLGTLFDITEPKPAELSRIRSKLFAQADKGLAQAGSNANDIVVRLSENVVCTANVESERAFRTGIGAVLRSAYLLHQEHHTQAMEELARVVNAGKFDWSAALKDIQR